MGRGITVDRRKSRITAGVFAILFGGAGLHKFYLGYIGTGLSTLLFATPFAYLGVAALVNGGAYYWFMSLPICLWNLVGVIEGIIYLGKSDEDFNTTYVQRKKRWF